MTTEPRFSAARIRAAARVLLRDAVGIAGAGLVTYGAWLVYAPAGFIVGGAFCIAVATLTVNA